MAERANAKRLQRSRISSGSSRKQPFPKKCECVIMEELRLMETRDQINDLTTPVQQPAVNRSPSLRDNPSVDYVDLTTDTPPSEQYVDLTRPSAPPCPLILSPLSPSPILLSQTPPSNQSNPVPLRSSCRYAHIPPPLPPSSPDIVLLNKTTHASNHDNDSFTKPSKSKAMKIFKDSNNSKHSRRDDLSCPVCLQTAPQFEAVGHKLVTTICGHVFCNVCIRNSILTSHRCPTCRRKLTLNQYHKLYI